MEPNFSTLMNLDSWYEAMYVHNAVHEATYPLFISTYHAAHAQSIIIRCQVLRMYKMYSRCIEQLNKVAWFFYAASYSAQMLPFYILNVLISYFIMQYYCMRSNYSWMKLSRFLRLGAPSANSNPRIF